MRNPKGGGAFPPNFFKARTMEDELAPTRQPAVVEPASSSESAIPEGTLLLPYEESCKKVRELALRQLNRFISYEAKVLKGDDADAIHDMRVASRRLQQVLDLLYPKPRPPELRRLRRQIRALPPSPGRLAQLRRYAGVCGAFPGKEALSAARGVDGGATFPTDAPV